MNAPFVLVTGGKGGVGKSTVAANLGVLFGTRGASTLLADLDLGLPDLDVLLDLSPDGSVADLLDGSRLPTDCVTDGPAGIGVVPGRGGSLALARPDEARTPRLLAALDELADERLIVGDSAAGIGPDVLELARAADRVVVVTTPDPAAVTDAYGVVKALDALGHESGTEIATPEVFVNLASSALEARTVAAHLRGVAERFLSRAPRLAGWMPRGRAVTSAARARTPFVLSSPESLATRGIRMLADRLERLLPPRPAPIPALKALDGSNR